MVKLSLKLTTVIAVLLAFLCIFAACTPTDSDTDTKTNIGASDVSSDTETNTESETETETDTDTDSATADTESETDTSDTSDVESDTESDTESESDTDTEGDSPLGPPEAHKHEYTRFLYDMKSTCQTLGYTVYGCICGEEQTIFSEEFGDHDYSIVFDVINATCTSGGYTIYVCACGDEITDDLTPIRGHNYMHVHEFSPSCTEKGYKRCYCDCGEYEDIDFVDALGHSFGEWSVYHHPSTTSDGEERRTCKECGEYEAKPIAKINLSYTFTKKDGKNVLTVSSSSPISYYSSTEPSSEAGSIVELQEIDKLVFGENITEISSLSEFLGVKEIVFSGAVEVISEYAIYQCDALEKIYFEGDAPTLKNNALTKNGAGSTLIIPSEESQGFGNGLLFGGQPLYRGEISSEIPKMTLYEYASKTANESVNLTREIVELFKSKGQESLLYMPYTVDMKEYAEIKSFTLELTKNCQTDLEKANVIFTYLMENIIYDYDYTYNSPYQVFKTQRGVCAGYVGLMHDMLSSVGVASFYTRGMTLFGCVETPETLLKETYTSETHAWLTVYFSNGDVKFYDPTWGVEYGNDYMEMSAEEIGDHVVTFEVSGLEVLIDEVDFSMLGGFHQFLHTDGKIYNTGDGIISLLSGTTLINDWFLDIVEIKQGNDATIYIDGTYHEVGTAINNGLYSYYYNDASRYYFAAADGKIYHPYTILNFLYTEYTLFGNELTLSLDGLIVDEAGIVYAKDYKGEYGAIAYLGTDTDIVIPATVLGNKVVSVNEGFLSYNSTAKSVTVSEGIKFVARYAFNKCSSLEYVYLPSTLEEKATNQYIAFVDCPNLKKIEISSENPYFATVDGNLYTKDMKVLLQYAPKNDIESFELPSTVQIIWEEAFSCSSLEYIALHDGLKEIQSSAFKYSCIREITIPRDCTIGPSAFFSSALRRVVIEDGITEIGAFAFSRCQMLTSVQLPSTLTYIPECAFSEATSLYKITLPSSVERIDSSAFSFSGINSITLSSSLVSIADLAFEGCYKLYHVNNLSSLSITKGEEDNGCIALYALSISDTVIDTIDVVDGFVFYVGEVVANYIGDDTTVVLPSYYNSKAYKISPYAFVGTSSYTWISLSFITPSWTNEVVHYGKYVQSIKIPKTVTEIPDFCFEGWDSLETVYYDGTFEEWKSVFISSTGNSAILEATKVFQRQ